MLDIGFREDIRKILKSIPTRIDRDVADGGRQTIFVSATVDVNIERLARSFMKPDAEKVTTVSGSLTVAMVDQKYFSVEPWDKRALLLKLLQREKPETTVVFCKTKATVRKVTQYLMDKNLNAREIHGDLQQSKRTKVMQAFRDEAVDVLVASDLAARGLDVDHITHVINYDLPEDPEVYIHRIGPHRPRRSAGPRLDLRHPRAGADAHRGREARRSRDPQAGLPRLQARPGPARRAGRARAGGAST